jgi:hypothetical protein
MDTAEFRTVVVALRAQLRQAALDPARRRFLRAYLALALSVADNEAHIPPAGYQFLWGSFFRFARAQAAWDREMLKQLEKLTAGLSEAMRERDSYQRLCRQMRRLVEQRPPPTRFN